MQSGRFCADFAGAFDRAGRVRAQWATDGHALTTAGLASEGATDCGQESEIPVLPHHCAADLPEPGRMPSRGPMWVPLGGACLKSSTFLQGRCARKKVTCEVPPADPGTSYPSRPARPLEEGVVLGSAGGTS